MPKSGSYVRGYHQIPDVIKSILVTLIFIDLFVPVDQVVPVSSESESRRYLGNHSSRALRVSSGFLVGFLSQPSLLEMRCTCVSTPKEKINTISDTHVQIYIIRKLIMLHTPNSTSDSLKTHHHTSTLSEQSDKVLCRTETITQLISYFDYRLDMQGVRCCDMPGKSLQTSISNRSRAAKELLSE